MKENLLLIMMCVPAILAAQNGVTVSNLAVNAGTVTFDVSWKNTGMPPVWSDSVWVFVDYNNAGKMERLLLDPGATLTATSAPGVGKVKEEPGNNKGVWVIGDARINSSFSATVQLQTVTTGVAGACAYASNYPPVGEYSSATNISFTGTPPYDLVVDTGSGIITDQSMSSYKLESGYTLKSFTDKTGAPGTFHCIPPAAPDVARGEFCYEQPGTLVATASGSVTIAWYDAVTGGTLLHTGEVLFLPPLYNNSAQYYAQAVYTDHCRSVRTQAEYTVANCPMSECPGYTAGNIDAPTTLVTCAVHYAGQIGSAVISPSCMAHDAGRIGQ
ncbi:MAG: hypothetical protein LBT61_01000 [Prevotellaceae bacterium]|jgi:hypothetical protein|nr:hypothetical protein [Prevotellaceae bacterium]